MGGTSASRTTPAILPGVTENWRVVPTLLASWQMSQGHPVRLLRHQQQQCLFPQRRPRVLLREARRRWPARRRRTRQSSSATRSAVRTAPCAGEEAHPRRRCMRVRVPERKWTAVSALRAPAAPAIDDGFFSGALLWRAERVSGVRCAVCIRTDDARASAGPDVIDLSDVDENMPAARPSVKRRRRFVRGIVVLPGRNPMIGPAPVAPRVTAEDRRRKREQEKAQKRQEELLRKISECSVCLEEFDDGPHAMMATRCGHVLCNACVGPVAASKACPTCRKRLTKATGFFRLYL